MRLILPILIVSVLSANGQALWRNFFSTNQNPRVTAVAGSNVTVQASTVGSDQRIFTINSVPPTNVAYSGFATNANFATNASNATNFWSILSPTNIPPLAYISNNVGNGTNVTLWGSNNVIKADGLGTTITPALWLTNGTAAALGAQQSSPAIGFAASAYRSGGTPGPHPVYASISLVGVQASAPPTGKLQFFMSSDSNGGTAYMTLDEYGTLNLASDFFGGGVVRCAAASSFQFGSSRSKIASPADSDMQVVNSAGTSFSRLFFGPLNSSWPALKVETTNSPTISFRTGNDGNYSSTIASNVTATANTFTFASSNGVVATNILQPLGQFGYLAMATTNTVTVGAGSTYYTLTNFSHWHTNGFTTIGTNGFVTNLIAGFYRIGYHLSAIPGNGDTIEAEVFFNETANEEGASFGSYSTPAVVRTLSASFVDYIPANTGISLRISNRSGANNITLWRAALTIGTP